MAKESESTDQNLHFEVKNFEEAWDIYKVRQDELSALSKAFVEAGQTAVADVNGKRMIFEGVGWAHPDIKKLLTAVGAAFNPMYIATPPHDGSKVKEYRLSVRYPWGQDRVM